LQFLHEYDANGNQVSSTDPTIGDSITFTYDIENRVTRIVDGIHGEACDYTYTWRGERISVACPTLTYYFYDFAAPGGLEDILAEYNATGVGLARYTHGPGADEPLGVLRSGVYYAYSTDGLGSVTRLTDASQATVRSYRYDAWGQTTSESGTLSNPYRFTARERDTSSDLYYFRARFYDPSVGRFLSKDPAGMVDGTNLYAYVGDNPVNRVDPTGTGKYYNGGGGGGFGDISTCYWFPMRSWGYHFCICMLYCLNVELVRLCVELWSSQYNEIPDCANYCGIYASQQTGAAGGPIADCPITGGIEFEQPGQYRSPRPSPSPLPKLPTD